MFVRMDMSLVLGQLYLSTLEKKRSLILNLNLYQFGRIVSCFVGISCVLNSG